MYTKHKQTDRQLLYFSNIDSGSLGPRSFKIARYSEPARLLAISEFLTGHTQAAGGVSLRGSNPDLEKMVKYIALC